MDQEEKQSTDLVGRILRALEEVRPFLRRDGGDIEFSDVQGSVVYVRLLGNCSSCHINNYTLKLGVEGIIKQHAPEITSIVNVEG